MQVFLAREAQKQYKSLDRPEQKKVDKKISLLGQDPLAGKKLTGKFEGLRSAKAWPYRVIYQIKESVGEIWIVSILHRQGVYR